MTLKHIYRSLEAQIQNEVTPKKSTNALLSNNSPSQRGSKVKHKLNFVDAAEEEAKYEKNENNTSDQLLKNSSPICDFSFIASDFADEWNTTLVRMQYFLI